MMEGLDLTLFEYILATDTGWKESEKQGLLFLQKIISETDTSFLVGNLYDAGVCIECDLALGVLIDRVPIEEHSKKVAMACHSVMENYFPAEFSTFGFEDHTVRFQYSYKWEVYNDARILLGNDGIWGQCEAMLTEMSIIVDAVAPLIIRFLQMEIDEDAFKKMAIASIKAWRQQGGEG